MACSICVDVVVVNLLISGNSNGEGANATMPAPGL